MMVPRYYHPVSPHDSLVGLVQDYPLGQIPHLDQVHSYSSAISDSTGKQPPLKLLSEHLSGRDGNGNAPLIWNQFAH